MYSIIYDGYCNLCSNLVKLLESFDRGTRFHYVPMQDAVSLQRYQITPEDCELGMILINESNPHQRWQGSAAAEEIGRLLPLGGLFVSAYRALPGIKKAGDKLYIFVRDNRYMLFGKRLETYVSRYVGCGSESCRFGE